MVGCPICDHLYFVVWYDWVKFEYIDRNLLAQQLLIRIIRRLLESFEQGCTHIDQIGSKLLCCSLLCIYSDIAFCKTWHYKEGYFVDERTSLRVVALNAKIGESVKWKIVERRVDWEVVCIYWHKWLSNKVDQIGCTTFNNALNHVDFDLASCCGCRRIGKSSFEEELVNAKVCLVTSLYADCVRVWKSVDCNPRGSWAAIRLDNLIALVRPSWWYIWRIYDKWHNWIVCLQVSSWRRNDQIFVI